ncbi:hypothetical protein M9458_022756, partial [Cirrhinus mrigala]
YREVVPYGGNQGLAELTYNQVNMKNFGKVHRKDNSGGRHAHLQRTEMAVLGFIMPLEE